MSHKSGHVVIERVVPPSSGGSPTHQHLVGTCSVELNFAPGTSLEARVKKIRQVERLLDKMDQDDDEQDVV